MNKVIRHSLHATLSLALLVVLTGCNEKKQADENIQIMHSTVRKITNVPPSSEQVNKFIKEKSIEPLDTKIFNNYAIIIEYNKVYSLLTDESGQIYSKSISWGGQDSVSCILVSKETPFLAMFINDNKLINEGKGAKVVLSNQSTLEFPLRGNKGIILPIEITNDIKTSIKKVYIYDNNKIELYESK